MILTYFDEIQTEIRILLEVRIGLSSKYQMIILTQKAKHNLAYYSFVELYDLDPSRAADKIEAGLEIQKQF